MGIKELYFKTNLMVLDEKSSLTSDPPNCITSNGVQFTIENRLFILGKI